MWEKWECAKGCDDGTEARDGGYSGGVCYATDSRGDVAANLAARIIGRCESMYVSND